ncbi:PHP domain-containing protein [Clostridium beijerinckii]|uniref:PHP domain-containing protein n=1 Tax=Clostridium beijerinckii TaxID=1520 RepID=UPI0022E258B2|nr:PHP domain-containing protein [Clostridium beijerinckii]
MPIDKEFNHRQLCRIEQLLDKKRNSYKVDLHIHTCYSADGLQTVEQAIQKAKEKQFDIISITDHDSINAYDEIIKKDLWENQDMPIIIPGVEFTVSYPEYEGRCHVLKYFFDTSNPGLKDNLDKNCRAYENRTHIWFQRIKENMCLQDYFKDYGISCSEKGYWDYLKNCTVKIPEYPTLMQYLYSLLSEKGIDVWNVYEKTVAYNDIDQCEERRKKKKVALKRFYNKYFGKEISHNFRKLRPILAPVGIDDTEFTGFKSSGCLSVNEYGQVSIQELINSGFNILAHPDGSKLHCVEELTEVLVGLEMNCHSDMDLNYEVQGKARRMGLIITKGSDKHSDTEEFYENDSFYNISSEELQQIVQCAKSVI